MKLASHNSLSYASVKQWYLKPFFWIAKCQSKDIEEQYKSGVRYFDFRLDGTVPAHGMIHYKVDLLKELAFLNNRKDCIVRLICENLYYSKDFINFCKFLEGTFADIKFCGGWYRNDRNLIIYHFKNEEPSCEDWYASFLQYLPDSKWYHKIYAIFPWLFNRLLKKKNTTNKEYLMLDFI